MGLDIFGAGEGTAAIVGALGNYITGNAATKKQYHYQSDLMAKQFAFAEHMANTAHQREVKDLRKAGLNPLLSVMGGQGAPSPTGNMGQINTPDYGSTTEAIATGLQVMRQKAENRLINEQAETEEVKRRNFESDSALKDSERMINEIERQYRGTKLESEINNYVADAKNKLATARASLITASANQVIANANAMNAETSRMELPSRIKLNKANAKYANERNRGGGMLETIGEGAQNWLDNMGLKRYSDNPFRRRN